MNKMLIYDNEVGNNNYDLLLFAAAEEESIKSAEVEQ